MAVTREIAQRWLAGYNARPMAKDIAIGSPGICTRPELGHDGPCNGYPAETCWRHISTVPARVLVLTKIDGDEHGARNIDTELFLDGDSYFRTRAGALVRYVPTHWRARGNVRPDEADSDITRAARLLRAAAEDAKAVLDDIGRDVRISKNHGIALWQVLINLNHAINHAKNAGIVRATDVDGAG